MCLVDGGKGFLPINKVHSEATVFTPRTTILLLKGRTEQSDQLLMGLFLIVLAIVFYTFFYQPVPFLFKAGFSVS
jgi:hypothetical protein